MRNGFSKNDAISMPKMIVFEEINFTDDDMLLIVSARIKPFGFAGRTAPARVVG